MSSRRRKRIEPHISFAKIHVPKMKSVFWKYFGFPTDENDQIITKQRVVCTLCRCVITNHYNTTNMRCHIQANHKGLFAELVDKHGINVPLRKAVKFERPYTEVINCENTPSSDRKESFYDEEAVNSILEEIPLTYEDTDRISKDQSSEDGMLSNIFEQIDKNLITPVYTDKKVKEMRTKNGKDDVNPIQVPVECNIDVALLKLIVKDLLNVSSIYNCGMQEFIEGFLGSRTIPPLTKVESMIANLHSDTFEKLKDQIKDHSQVKAYSLSFDVWNNIESKEFVSIFFNNISDEFEYQFCDNLYMTVELNDFTMFDQIFEDFKLQNCSAAIINCNHKILNTFLSNNDIPIVHCFSHIVNTCIDDVFKIDEVSKIMDEIGDVIARYASEICLANVEVPTVCHGFPTTKLVLLKFFVESVSWPEEVDPLVIKARRILEVMSPLEVTLETLKEEEIPLSSLFVPFANKITEKHFVIDRHDDFLVQQIKSTIVREFKRTICSNNYLTVTALLDPRFHKYISFNNVITCVNILENKILQLIKNRGEIKKCEKDTESESQKKSRKSNIKLFFDVFDTPLKQAKSEALIETELHRYREEAFASLEDSPLMWWNQWGSVYGSLKQLADAYHCVLGFVNLRFKDSLKDQIDFHRKRYMLAGKLVDHILFLNKVR